MIGSRIRARHERRQIDIGEDRVDAHYLNNGNIGICKTGNSRT